MVLAMVDPAGVEKQRRVRPATAGGGGLFRRGDLAPAPLAALQSLDLPATSSEVATTMLVAKELEADDPRLTGLANRVSGAFCDWVTKGQVDRIG